MAGFVRTPTDIVTNLISGNSPLYRGPRSGDFGFGGGIIPVSGGAMPQPPVVEAQSAWDINDIPTRMGRYGIIENPNDLQYPMLIPDPVDEPFFPPFGEDAGPILPKIPGGPGYPDRATRADLIAAAQSEGAGQGDELFPPSEYGESGGGGFDFDQLMAALGGDQSQIAPTSTMDGSGSPIMDWLGFDTPENQGRFTDLGDTLIDLGARMMAGNSPEFFQNVGNAVLGTNAMLDTKKETQFNRDLAIAEYNQRDRIAQQNAMLGIGQLIVQNDATQANIAQANRPALQTYVNEAGQLIMLATYPDGQVASKILPEGVIPKDNSIPPWLQSAIKIYEQSDDPSSLPDNIRIPVEQYMQFMWTNAQ